MSKNANKFATVNAERRHQTLSSLLLWEGRLSNARLREVLSLAPLQASLWIREFRDQHPRWTKWSTTTRSYYATWAVFKDISDPVERADLFSHYLTLVGTEGDERLTVMSVVKDMVSPSPEVFGQLTEAIRVGKGVRFTYRSMKNPKAHSRNVVPKTVVLSGRRWHLRAYCLETFSYRDFNLSRMDSLAQGEELAGTMPADKAWDTEISLRMVPHPDLTLDQQDVVRFEYMNQTMGRVVKIRAALLPYLIQEFRIATNLKKQLPPDYQLAVGNLDEIKTWLLPE